MTDTADLTAPERRHRALQAALAPAAGSEYVGAADGLTLYEGLDSHATPMRDLLAGGHREMTRRAIAARDNV
jgi:hypothetical protein